HQEAGGAGERQDPLEDDPDQAEGAGAGSQHGADAVQGERPAPDPAREVRVAGPGRRPGCGGRGEGRGGDVRHAVASQSALCAPEREPVMITPATAFTARVSTNRTRPAAISAESMAGEDSPYHSAIRLGME